MADVTIQVLKNGPLVVKGTAQMVDAEGNPISTQGPAVALCRCGHSAKKPFCDGSHRTANFQG